MIGILISILTVYLLFSSAYGAVLSDRHDLHSSDWRPMKKYYQHKYIPQNNIPSWDDVTQYQYVQKKQGSTTESPEPCKGFDNILNDIGIVNLVLAIIGTILGVTTDVFSVFGNFTSILSILLGGTPSSILIILERLFAVQTEPIATGVDILTILDTIANLGFNVPFGIVTTIMSAFGDFLSVISVGLGIFTLFPEAVEETFNVIFGKQFVKYYGCNNPYINNQFIQSMLS